MRQFALRCRYQQRFNKTLSHTGFSGKLLRVSFHLFVFTQLIQGKQCKLTFRQQINSPSIWSVHQRCTRLLHIVDTRAMLDRLRRVKSSCAGITAVCRCRQQKLAQRRLLTFHLKVKRASLVRALQHFRMACSPQLHSMPARPQENDCEAQIKSY